jgi:outer membrane murein-binding lipoprotein Lpp
MVRPNLIAAAVVAAALMPGAEGQATNREQSQFDQILLQLQQLRDENHKLRDDMDNLRRQMADLKAAATSAPASGFRSRQLACVFCRRAV